MKEITWEAGMNLASLATKYIGSEEHFKYIAKVNKLSLFNQSIKPGTKLQIPSLEEVHALFTESDDLQKKISELSLPGTGTALDGSVKIRPFIFAR
jgi:hypothetical protein